MVYLKSSSQCCQAWFNKVQIRRRLGTANRKEKNEVQNRRLRLISIRNRLATTRSFAE